MMKPYRYLLLDLDNTLLDFDLAEKTAFAAAFSASGIPSTPEIYAAYHAINDALWKQLERGEVSRERLLVLRFEQLLAHMGRPDTDGLSRRLSEDYFAFLAKQRHLVPGALEVVEMLSHHYALYIITNGTYAVQRGRYYGSGLEPYMSGIFISELMGVAKPSPAFFAQVFASVGDDNPAHYCVVGDSLSSDIAGAAASHIDAIWLDANHTGDTHGLPVTHILDDIRKLPHCFMQN